MHACIHGYTRTPPNAHPHVRACNCTCTLMRSVQLALASMPLVLTSAIQESIFLSELPSIRKQHASLWGKALGTWLWRARDWRGFDRTGMHCVWGRGDWYYYYYYCEVGAWSGFGFAAHIFGSVFRQRWFTVEVSRYLQST